MPTMLTFHCKRCDKRFYRKREGQRKGIYCSRSCLAKNTIAGMDSHMRWMNIKKNPPKKDGTYWVWDEKWRSQTQATFKDGYFLLLDYPEVRHINHNYTHWMPLPKPPKELRRKLKKDKNG